MRMNQFMKGSVQFSSVTQSWLTPCNPMDRSMPGLPVHHQIPEFTQTRVHCVRDERIGKVFILTLLINVLLFKDNL